MGKLVITGVILIKTYVLIDCFITRRLILRLGGLIQC